MPFSFNSSYGVDADVKWFCGISKQCERRPFDVVDWESSAFMLTGVVVVVIAANVVDDGFVACRFKISRMTNSTAASWKLIKISLWTKPYGSMDT